MADAVSAVAYGTAAQGQAVYGSSPTTAVWAYSPWDSTTVTAAAAAGAGTSPPAPAVAAGSTIIRGSLTFGTGTSTAASTVVTVTFGSTLPAVPTVVISPTTAVTGTIQTAVTAVTTTGFSIANNVAPTASGTVTTYGVSWYASL
jgi:hypothetical protein